MKKIILCIGLLMMLVGCKNKMVTYKDVVNMKDTIIVDVRENIEFKNGHILGAINIPLNTIEEDIQLDKDKTIIVYCKSGNRSSMAQDKLEQLGYKVYDLGSIDNWKGNIVEE